MRLKTTIVTLLLLAVFALPVIAQEIRHHIGLNLGYLKLISDDVKDETSGLDFSNSALGGFNYRFSVNRNVDLCIDSRATFSSQNDAGTDLHLINSYFGPGVRLVAPQNNLALFVQGNFYFVNEEVEIVQGNTKISASESGVGFGVNGGVDIRLSRLLSMPVEVNFLYADPADNVSGFGISTGLTFNFGRSHQP
jgi:hypothetical protein